MIIMTATTVRKVRKPSAADIERKAAEYTSITDQLEAFVEELDEDDVRIINKIKKFSAHYSERNAMLIVMQRPTATETHGYKEWLSKGRQVRKGQHGIRILAPSGQAGGTDAQPATETTPAVDGKAGRQFFRLISVFDKAQTEDITAA